MSWVILHRSLERDEKPVTMKGSRRNYIDTILDDLEKGIGEVLMRSTVQSAWAFLPMRYFRGGPDDARRNLEDVVRVVLNERIIERSSSWGSHYYCSTADYDDLDGVPAFAGVHLWRKG
jgi:hypothetical protein